MLQYAVPSAPTSFSKPQSVFAEPSPRSASTITSSEAPSNTPISEKSFLVARYGPGTSLGTQESSRSEEYLSGSQSPALSALASLAASAPIAIASPKETSGESSLNREKSMNQSQYAPAATAGGTQNGPPVCQNCKTSTTPLWRRDEAGSVLCNACGLFLKLHGRARPISLKTDVIKSRNRVKTSQTKKRDSHGAGDGMPHPPNGYPAAHPQIAHADPHHLPPGAIQGEHPHHIPSPTSLSRSNTPGLSAHNAAIAPQHIFDSVSLTPDNFANPFSLRHQSPSGSPLNGNATGGPDAANAVAPAQTYEAIVAQNNQLRTRVSELEVINDLFRGRVGELESNQHEARRRESMKSEEAQRLASDLETSKARVAELEKRLRELQPERGDGHDEEEGGPARKISRTNSADDVHS